MKPEEVYTEKKLDSLGYKYLGKYAPDKDGNKNNQMWSWEKYEDEFVIFNPEKQRIIGTSFDDK